MKVLLYRTQSESVILLLIGIAIALLLFLAFRAIVLWYWKIDTLVKNQQKQIDLLTKILLAIPEKKIRDN